MSTFAGGYYYQPSYRRETRAERQRRIRAERLERAVKNTAYTFAGVIVASALIALMLTVL